MNNHKLTNDRLITSLREKTSIEGLESRIPLSLKQGNDLPHSALHLRGFHSIVDPFDYGLRVVYWGTVVADHPLFDGTVP